MSIAETAVATIVIESNRLIREGLRLLLAETPFSVTGLFATPSEAMAIGDGVEIGMVLVDVPTDRMEELRALKEGFPAAKIVMLTDELSVARMQAATKAGIDGYLMKDISTSVLAHSLHLVLLGEKVFPAGVADMLADLRIAVAPIDLQPAPMRLLSPREGEILQHLVTGASNKLIGIKLGITEATVKVHLKALLRKLNVSNRTQAAIWARSNGVQAANAA